MYALKADSGVTDDWLIAEYIPQTSDKYGRRVAMVLGKALLWAANEPTMLFLIPDVLMNRLSARYLAVRRLPDGENPVVKQQLVVYSVGGNLQIDETGVEPDIGNVNTGGISELAATHPTIQALVAQKAAIRQQNRDIMTTLQNQHEQLRAELNTLRRTVNRFANRPAQAIGGMFINKHDQGNGTVSDSASTQQQGVRTKVKYEVSLSACPRDLFQLWEEYEFGLQGRKAAKRFSTRERGAAKYKYHRRKVVWDMIVQMIRQGHTYLTAIDEIYGIYGREATVTQIINRMRKDRRRGGHAQLR
jgi:hypothetical protein